MTKFLCSFYEDQNNVDSSSYMPKIEVIKMYQSYNNFKKIQIDIKIFSIQFDNGFQIVSNAYINANIN